VKLRGRDTLGLPARISIYPTPECWRFSTWTTKQVLACGALEDIPADSADDTAKEAAVRFVNYLSSKSGLRSPTLGITWEAAENGWWNGAVYRLDGKPL
jgi:hypothetical protein